ncbi:ATP-dependent DNA helicase [Mycena leptocephala]|nr:ATP-dependent DNA helicase [Mycena leptocephala]
MDSDSEFPQYLTQDDPTPEYSSSVLHTPPAVTYSNLVGPSHSKARTLRREPSGLVDCHRVLTKTFGHSEYKGKQREIVEAAVRGADIFVLAPTGMGKSLCFQVPAVAESHGVTIVISPLLALMKNQVSGLREKHIPVASLTSETSLTDKTNIVRDLSSGHPENRLLYITPEKFCSSDFLKILTMVYEQKELNRLVVDEAHCISEWGHDFRAEYRRLGFFRKKFEDIPIMALTATATPSVQLDIIRSLGMSEEHLVKVVHPFNRANLFYEVRYMSTPNPASQMPDISDYIFTLHQRRGDHPPASSIAERAPLAMSSQRISELCNARQDVERMVSWGAGNGGVDVVCATIAFGLGIDKGDVRYIIHYDLPKSLEGRAGRDGSPSKCILYYSREDVIRVKRQRALDSLTSLVQFAESTDVCRHVAICRYFGEPIDMADKEVVMKYCNKMCDICKYPEKTKRRHSNLSSEEHAGTQVPAYVARDEDDDDYPPRAGSSRTDSHNTNHKNSDTVWRKNFRDGEVQPNNKRSRSEQSNQPDRYKKAKGASSSTPSYGKALATKPFRSAMDLKKPFKTPFLAPITVDSSPEVEVEERETSPVVPDDADVDLEVQVGDSKSSRPSSPIDLPDAEIALDVSFSQKIEATLRHTGLTTIRKALHKVFLRGLKFEEMWLHLSKADTDLDTRVSLLNNAAHSLEFSALSMCSTADGYECRTEGTVEAVRFLGKHWDALDSPGAQQDEDEWEDARAVLAVLKQVCGRS